MTLKYKMQGSGSNGGLQKRQLRFILTLTLREISIGAPRGAVLSFEAHGGEEVAISRGVAAPEAGVRTRVSERLELPLWLVFDGRKRRFFPQRVTIYVLANFPSFRRRLGCCVLDAAGPLNDSLLSSAETLRVEGAACRDASLSLGLSFEFLGEATPNPADPLPSFLSAAAPGGSRRTLARSRDKLLSSRHANSNDKVSFQRAYAAQQSLIFDLRRRLEHPEPQCLPQPQSQPRSGALPRRRVTLAALFVGANEPGLSEPSEIFCRPGEPRRLLCDEDDTPPLNIDCSSLLENGPGRYNQGDSRLSLPREIFKERSDFNPSRTEEVSTTFPMDLLRFSEHEPAQPSPLSDGSTDHRSRFASAHTPPRKPIPHPLYPSSRSPLLRPSSPPHSHDADLSAGLVLTRSRDEIKTPSPAPKIRLSSLKTLQRLPLIISARRLATKQPAKKDLLNVRGLVAQKTTEKPKEVPVSVSTTVADSGVLAKPVRNLSSSSFQLYTNPKQLSARNQESFLFLSKRSKPQTAPVLLPSREVSQVSGFHRPRVEKPVAVRAKANFDFSGHQEIAFQGVVVEPPPPDRVSRSSIVTFGQQEVRPLSQIPPLETPEKLREILESKKRELRFLEISVANAGKRISSIKEQGQNFDFERQSAISLFQELGEKKKTLESTNVRLASLYQQKNDKLTKTINLIYDSKITELLEQIEKDF